MSRRPPKHVRGCRCDTCTDGHTCHVPGCTARCPRRYLMCRPHWRQLPAEMRHEVYAAYCDGQERGLKRPSKRWLRAARTAVNYITGLRRQGELFG